MTYSRHLIPQKIWQILLPKTQMDDHYGFVKDTKILQCTTSWLALNIDYAYTLVGKRRSDDFVQSYFTYDPRIDKAYNAITNVGMKSDLLRYLILDIEGGVYTDTDTIALKPIDNWVNPNLQDQVRLVVGIEYDRRDGDEWNEIPHWLQFCQWTIAAAPGHPVFRKMVAHILQSLEALSHAYKLPIDQIHPTNFEILNSTGPAAWTDVVFEILQEHDPSLNSTKDLSFMTEPRLYGDILVLPIDAFGMGQAHSNSTNDGTIPTSALLRHQFHGSWRED
ncbi:glycosyltransferase family 32 protein [Trichoderma velutinum]